MAPMCLRKPSLLLLITFNILLFTLVTSTCTCPPKVTPPKPPTSPPKVTPPKPPTSPPKVTPTPKPPTSPPKVTPPKPPTTPLKVTPTPKPPTSPPKVTPSPKPPTSPPKVTPTPKPPTSLPKATCPVDVLKLGVCANLLNDLLHLVVGAPSKTPCCPLLNGLADLDAAVCLCTAIKADILGIHLNVPVSLSLLLNYCGKKVPAGFKCS